MDPALWRTLPKDLLHLVYARLPMPEFVRLRYLSKGWNWYVIAKESPFRRACASTKASTNMFAIATEFAECWGVFTMWLYDTNPSKWHSFEIPDIDCGGKYGDQFDTIVASDGGMVCFFLGLLRYSTWFEHKPILILVGNPLTRELKALPSGSFLNTDRPKMVQFLMDRETICYQVIVVGNNGAEIYNSATGVWSNTGFISDLVFGYQYHWEGGGQRVWSEGTRLGPCVFDSGQGRLLNVDEHSNPCRQEFVKSYALLGDRLFVLHQEIYNESFSRRRRDVGIRRFQQRQYCISEYEGYVGSRGLIWMKLKVHRCGSDFEMPPKSEFYKIRLHACKGFLLVLVSNDENQNYGYKQDLAWLYDMAMEKWCKLPQMLSSCSVASCQLYEYLLKIFFPGN